jgi:DNA polymerase-3 subunit epsilon/oligoribonuclease
MQAIFLDIETTGLDPLRHSPLDIAIKIVDLSELSLKGEYASSIQVSHKKWLDSDPTSVQINGYTLERAEMGAPIETVKEEIIAFFKLHGIARGSAFFICQNPAFDRGFFNHIVDVYTQESLLWPYHWLDLASMYWVRVMDQHLDSGATIPLKTNLSKNSIAKVYDLPEESTPHTACNGVNHLLACFQKVFNLDFSAEAVSSGLSIG